MRIYSLLSPKENQKRAASFEARGTNQGLLPLITPFMFATLKNLGDSRIRVKISIQIFQLR